MDQDRIDHIRAAIADIEGIVAEGRVAFFNTRRSQAATVYWLGIIGEAANKLSEALKAKYPDVKWRRIADFRNVAFHEYEAVDLGIVWDLAAGRIPELKQHIELISRELTK